MKMYICMGLLFLVHQITLLILIIELLTILNLLMSLVHLITLDFLMNTLALYF